MSEIRITFNKEWDIEKREQEIAKRIYETLADCNILKMQLEKEYDRVGNVVKVETRTWDGPKEMELMLKTATSFLITYEHKN